MIAKLEIVKRRLSHFLVVLLVVAITQKERVFRFEEWTVGRLTTFFQPRTGQSSDSSPAISSSQEHTDHALLELMLVVILVFVYASGELIVHYSFERRRLIRRLAMGREDVEGIWVDLVISGDTIVGAGYIVVEYADGAYVIEGEDYDVAGAFKASFETTLSGYRDARLSYKYSSTRLSEKGKTTGHGVYHFHGTGQKRVWNFDGEFFIDEHPRKYYTYGERLKDFVPESREYRRLRRPEHRKELMLLFLSKRASRFGK